MFGRRNRDDGDVGDDGDVVESVDERGGRTWSPAQIVAVVLGIAAIVFGALALADTGLNLNDVTEPHRNVLGFDTTPLLGLSRIAWGVLMLLAGLRAVTGRSLMALLGAAALALGILVAIEAWPGTLHDWLGTHEKNGWLMIGVGAVALLATFVLPVVTTPRTKVVREREVVHG